jgi:hypothetical protein
MPKLQNFTQPTGTGLYNTSFIRLFGKWGITCRGPLATLARKAMGSLFKKLMRDHFMEAIAKGLIGPLSMMLMRPFGKSLMG